MANIKALMADIECRMAKTILLWRKLSGWLRRYGGIVKEQPDVSCLEHPVTGFFSPMLLIRAAFCLELPFLPQYAGAQQVQSEPTARRRAASDAVPLSNIGSTVRLPP